MDASWGFANRRTHHPRQRRQEEFSGRDAATRARPSATPLAYGTTSNNATTVERTLPFLGCQLLDTHPPRLGNSTAPLGVADTHTREDRRELLPSPGAYRTAGTDRDKRRRTWPTLTKAPLGMM